MRYRAALVLTLLSCVGVLSYGYAQQAPETSPSPLHVALGKSQTIVVTVTNPTSKPMFFLRPDRPGHWYGWGLTITSTKGAFGFTPAPSPWVGGPECFILLNPGESFQTTLDLSNAHKMPDGAEVLASTRGTYTVDLAYTFDADAEIRVNHQSQFARIMSVLTSNNFRPLDYGFMSKASARIAIVVK